MTSASYTHLLKISNSSALNEFLHECVDDLLQKRKASFENYNNGEVEWTQEDFDKARSYIQDLYRQGVLDNLELPHDLSTDLQEAVARCFKIRKNDIFQALAKGSILENGNYLVDNINWRLKWILGSSDLATLQEPKLQIDLHCSKKNENGIIKNTVNFEANLEQINNLISDLTKIQKELL